MLVVSKPKTNKKEKQMSSVFSSASVKQRTTVMQRQLLGGLPKKLQGLAAFGLQALVRTPFVSCNANARMTAGKRVAAEMRMYRLLRHERLASLVMTTVQRALPLERRSVLNIDFSNFGGVAVLVAALQTDKGRALPWTLEALASNVQGMKRTDTGYERSKIAYQQWKRESGGDQYDLVLKLTERIDRAAASPPCLVFDRGFGNKRLLTVLLARNGNSYIRMRDSFRLWVETPREYRGEHHIGNLAEGDYQVQWLGLRFRLVVATTNKARAKGAIAPWAIATNDKHSTPRHIAKLYYHRFEIEETFRDWKSGLGLRHARLTRWQSLQVLLSFASVATLLAWKATRSLALPQQPVHAKKQCSFFRIWHETIRQAGLRRPAARGSG
jgi:hypothetical protein